MLEDALRRVKLRAAALSIVSNTLLVVLKLVVGVMTLSVSVISEAVHSASDLVASLLAFFGIRAAAAPADEGHPYGHGKAESLSAFVQALLIFAGGCVVVVEALRRIVHPAEIQVDLAIGVMLLSAVANTLVSAYLLRVARQTESPALKADGYHLLTDVWTSVGVLAGLVLVKLTHWHIVDPLVAIGVSLMIMRLSWHLTLEAVHPLMDAALPQWEEEKIRAILLSDSHVRDFHKLRTRRSGRSRMVDVHVLLDDDLSLVDAHHIAEELEDKVRQAFPKVEVSIHFEPHEAELLHQQTHHA
ncbi:MAG: cation transporter [Fimbriimonadia bacterium]|jgi:cation diffusion facilitator family transporter